jgi:hypothetical protein
MTNDPTIPQILVGLGLFTAGSLGLCALIWLGKHHRQAPRLAQPPPRVGY